MITQHFDAATELKNVREMKKVRRRKSFRSSRLARYRAELIALRQSGASFRELALWLRQKKRVKVNHTTVLRYLHSLPELREKNHAELS